MIGSAQQLQCDIPQRTLAWVKAYQEGTISFQGIRYQVINANTSCIDHRPAIVLYGGSAVNHAIYINPATFHAYAKRCLAFVNQYHHQNRVENMLYLVKEYVAQVLSVADKTIIQEISKAHKQKGFTLRTMYSGQIPCIDIAEFVQRGVGVCRHHTVFTAACLQYLMEQGVLPQGKVYYHRQYLSTSPHNKLKHAWVIYRQGPQHGGKPRVYSVDTFWGKGFADESIIDISTPQGLARVDAFYASKLQIKDGVSQLLSGRYLQNDCITPLYAQRSQARESHRNHQQPSVLSRHYKVQKPA